MRRFDIEVSVSHIGTGWNPAMVDLISELLLAHSDRNPGGKGSRIAAWFLADLEDGGIGRAGSTRRVMDGGIRVYRDMA